MVKTEKEIIEELKEEVKGLKEYVKEVNEKIETDAELKKELLKEFKQVAQMLTNKIEVIDRLNNSLKKHEYDKQLLTQENRKLKKIIKENGLQIGN